MFRKSTDYANVLDKKIFKSRARYLNRSVDFQDRLSFKPDTDRRGKVREVAMLVDDTDNKLELELLKTIKDAKPKQLRFY